MAEAGPDGPGGRATLRFAGAARRGETVPSPASEPGSSTKPHAGRGVDWADCSPGEDKEHDPYTLRDLGPGPGLAIGTGPAFLPTLAQAQVPTSQFSPGSTPLNDSRSNRGAPDVAPNPNEPVSRATRGATPRDDSRSADNARGGPGTGPVRPRSMQGGRPSRHQAGSASPTSDASQPAGVVTGGPDARRSTSNTNGAFLGGGGVFERAPDGSLRQVMR